MMRTKKVLQERADYLRQFAKVQDENFKRSGISAADAMRMAAMMMGDDFKNYQTVFFGERETPDKTQEDAFVNAVGDTFERCDSDKGSSISLFS